ncbi:MAG: glycogen/starch/alpha-glucan family phosphorylase [Lachnospiraceae bacterium]|jgi:starch phosphorylase|nr:glycogen/starch/alpha-glucan family phosphorylase [Lachnospiraceae bacterium]
MLTLEQEITALGGGPISDLSDEALYAGLCELVKNKLLAAEGPPGGGRPHHVIATPGGAAAGATHGRAAASGAPCALPKKKLYYISAEFLIGKLLSNNLINLGIYDQVRELLERNGKSLARLEEMEPEPSLGNGGLGRLAACFLDSLATLGLPGDGVGLCYHLGLFRQVFEDNLQKELPNPWIHGEYGGPGADGDMPRPARTQGSSAGDGALAGAGQGGHDGAQGSCADDKMPGPARTQGSSAGDGALVGAGQGGHDGAQGAGSADTRWLIKTDVHYPVRFGPFTLQSDMYDIQVAGYTGSEEGRGRGARGAADAADVPRHASGAGVTLPDVGAAPGGEAAWAAPPTRAGESPSEADLGSVGSFTAADGDGPSDAPLTTAEGGALPTDVPSAAGLRPDVPPRTNRLHLFDLPGVRESIVRDGIAFDKEDVPEGLTLFLYPDDSDDAGRLLRIFQEYFMVSNAAQLILDECTARGSLLHDLPDYAVIQINDTHPTMVIPELIRLLMERGIEADAAIDIVGRTCAYTNHTILAEALETWPIAFLKKAVPHLVPIIEMLDDRVRRRFDDESLAIIDRDDRVHMAHIDIHYGFSVNGVAALHTEILKKDELNNFYRIYPDRFNNKTNGITFRRWLLHCNPRLTGFIRELIGPGFKKDATELEKLIPYENDPAALEKLLEIKSANKADLAGYFRRLHDHRPLDPASIFDVQSKRLHEYKRQQLNALYLIRKYLEIKAGRLPASPITAIFAAKAAPAYTIAKDIIHLILCLSSLTQADTRVSPHLRVVMAENYNVTLAEKLIPAADISEQISLSSKEASGTGNMKFMLNGAVTLGTEDGANVEIHRLVGDEKIYVFGKASDEVIALYRSGAYHPWEYIERDETIRACVDFITGPEMLGVGSEGHLRRLSDELRGKDYFMTFLDFEDYCRTKDRACADWADRMGWAKKMLHNIAMAGYFSSDRTIAQYDAEIWKLS